MHPVFPNVGRRFAVPTYELGRVLRVTALAVFDPIRIVGVSESGCFGVGRVSRVVCGVTHRSLTPVGYRRDVIRRCITPPSLRMASGGLRLRLTHPTRYLALSGGWKFRSSTSMACAGRNLPGCGLLDESFVDKLASRGGNFVSLPRPADDSTPTFSYELCSDAARHQAVTETSVHARHREPHVWLIEFQ